jgi:hypothetical protein
MSGTFAAATGDIPAWIDARVRTRTGGAPP